MQCPTRSWCHVMGFLCNVRSWGYVKLLSEVLPARLKRARQQCERFREIRVLDTGKNKKPKTKAKKYPKRKRKDKMNWQKPNTNSHSYADNYATCSDLHERSAQNEREQKNSTRAVGSKYLLVHAAAVAVLRCMPYRSQHLRNVTIW